MKIRSIQYVLFMFTMMLGGIISGANGLAQEPNEMQVANVKEFGAKGDGKTDDTEAIEKAWAFVMDTRKPQFHNVNPKVERGFIAVNTALYFPPGVYRYMGKGLDSTGNVSQCWQVRGDGMNSVRIEIESDSYFINCGYVVSTVIEGISFSGGKGVFRSTWTKNMAAGRHIFRDCYFVNYTECAIGNNAEDSPYLSVEDCTFSGRVMSPSIGIAWGGYFDDSQITRCAFERNKYHIKLGDRLSGNLQIGPRNCFISFGGMKKEADIWIVPNSDPNDNGVNSGQGIIIGENKFGNENRDTDKPRILIALEDKESGADRLSRQHSAAAVPGTGNYVTGVKLRDNLISGASGEKRGIVYSYIAQAAIIFDHNYHMGGPYKYLIEFDEGIKRLQDHPPGNTSYVYPQERDNKQLGLLLPAISNLPGYAIPFDPDQFFAGSPETPSVWQRDDDPGYLPIASLPGKLMVVSGTGQIKAAADAHGGETAADFTSLAKSAGLAVRLDDSKQLQEGRVGFIEVELKRADVAPLDTVCIWLAHNAGQSNERVTARTVRLQSSWQRITLPFVIRNLDEGTFHLILSAEQFLPGVQERFICGNVRVYHAAAPHSGVREGVRNVGDRDSTITLGLDPEQIICTAALTADRQLFFVTPHSSVRPLPGAKYRISRPGGGPHLLKIPGVTNIAAGEWCEMIFDGAVYQVTARGNLR